MMLRCHCLLCAVVVLSATCFLLHGCTEACTLIGCATGVSVELEPHISSGYRVDIVADGVTASFDCDFDAVLSPHATAVAGDPAVTLCDFGGFFIESTPRELEVTVTAHDGSWSGSQPSGPVFYSELEPNGAGCGPTCRSSNVRIEGCRSFATEPGISIVAPADETTIEGRTVPMEFVVWGFYLAPRHECGGCELCGQVLASGPPTFCDTPSEQLLWQSPATISVAQASGECQGDDSGPAQVTLALVRDGVEPVTDALGDPVQATVTVIRP